MTICPDVAVAQVGYAVGGEVLDTTKLQGQRYPLAAWPKNLFSFYSQADKIMGKFSARIPFEVLGIIS